MVGPTITAAVNPAMSKLHKILELNRDDMKKMTVSMDTLFVKNEKRLFATEGSSGGVKWKKLKPETLKAKKRRATGVRKIKRRGFSIPLTGTSLKIMQRTGRLRKGLSVKKDPDHVVRFSLVSRSAWIGIGVKSILPVYHGAVRGRRKNPKLPRRSVFQMKPQQRRGYYQVLFKRFDLKRKQWMRSIRAGRAAMRRGAAR